MCNRERFDHASNALEAHQVGNEETRIDVVVLREELPSRMTDLEQLRRLVGACDGDLLLVRCEGVLDDHVVEFRGQILHALRQVFEIDLILGVWSHVAGLVLIESVLIENSVVSRRSGVEVSCGFRQIEEASRQDFHMRPA